MLGGEGEGSEWTDALEREDNDVDAMDLDPGTVVGAPSGSGNNRRPRRKKFERGPFVFWC